MTAYTQLNDAELIALLNQGDEGAYTEIYNRYWKNLFTLATNKLGNVYEAEEVVQDIFLDIWKRRNTLSITATLSAYLSVSINFKVINILARRSLFLRYSREFSHNRTEMDHCTEQWLQAEELKEIFEKLVTDLPEKCRLVFSLSREKGLSHKEIATTLKIAEKTVEAHLSRALRSLRTIINMVLVLV